MQINIVDVRDVTEKHVRAERGGRRALLTVSGEMMMNDIAKALKAASERRWARSTLLASLGGCFLH